MYISKSKKVEDSDFPVFVVNWTKQEIPSKIKPPVSRWKPCNFDVGIGIWI